VRFVAWERAGANRGAARTAVLGLIREARRKYVRPNGCACGRTTHQILHNEDKGASAMVRLCLVQIDHGG